MNIIFLGLARNCSATLPAFFNHLRELKSIGLQCKAVIGEDGSKDDTRKLLDGARSDGVYVLDTAVMQGIPDRLTRMAVGRQTLLDANRDLVAESDFVCVVDLDSAMRRPPRPSSVQEALQELNEKPDLFAIGASSRPVYYDLLSLRHGDLDFDHLHSEILNAKKNVWSYYRFHREIIYRSQSAVSQDPLPWFVESSFNGFCIYRSSDYVLGSYRSAREAQVCEHVTLNQSLAQVTGRKMMVSLGLAIDAPKEHISVDALTFLWMRFRKKISG